MTEKVLADVGPTVGYAPQPGSVGLVNGPEWRNAPLEEVQDFLQRRRIEDRVVWPSELTFLDDGTRILLCYRKEPVWPVRRVFFEKLCKWHNLSPRTLLRMDRTLVVGVLNNMLRLITKRVGVRLEDGDALTLTSQLYSRLNDLTVIKESVKLGITKVDRNDGMMRIYTEMREDIQVVVGDVCGVGMNVFNSETGFMALRAVSYILRYTCSNGAIGPIHIGGDERLIHYDVDHRMFSEYLARSVREFSGVAARIEKLLRRSITHSLPRPECIRRHLDWQLNYQTVQNLMGRAPTVGSLYDLYNYLTDAAKELEIGERARLEEAAFRLLGDTVQNPHGSRHSGEIGY